MNKVFISGMIAYDPIFRKENGDISHFILALGVRHKTRSGETKRENYRVSAWNGTADWAKDNLIAGQIVAVQGYLTQHTSRDGAIITEIAAEEFIPSRQTSFRPAQTAGIEVIASVEASKCELDATPANSSAEPEDSAEAKVA